MYILTWSSRLIHKSIITVGKALMADKNFQKHRQSALTMNALRN